MNISNYLLLFIGIAIATWLAPAITVPPNPSQHKSGYTIRLGREWSETTREQGFESLSEPPYFVRLSRKGHRLEAYMTIVSIANPPNDIVSSWQQVIARNKGTMIFTPIVWGQLKGGWHAFRPPISKMKGHKFKADVTVVLYGRSVIAIIAARYCAPMTQADLNEFFAMAKSFKPLNESPK